MQMGVRVSMTHQLTSDAMSRQNRSSGPYQHAKEWAEGRECGMIPQSGSSKCMFTREQGCILLLTTCRPCTATQSHKLASSNAAQQNLNHDGQGSRPSLGRSPRVRSRLPTSLRPRPRILHCHIDGGGQYVTVRGDAINMQHVRTATSSKAACSAGSTLTHTALKSRNAFHYHSMGNCRPLACARRRWPRSDMRSKPSERAIPIMVSPCEQVGVRCGHAAASCNECVLAATT